MISSQLGAIILAMVRRLIFGVLLWLVATPAVGEQRYSADRYDSRIEVLDGGTIRVTETIALRFESGTFKQFYRAVPTRLTDGVEIVSAAMDGQPFSTGDGPQHVEVSGSSNVRVTWHFPPTSESAHTFDLVYLVHGVVRQDDDADIIAWRILPTEHRYQIASSTAEILLPAAPMMTPAVETRRVADSNVQVADGRVRIAATGIRGNGWFEAWIRLPRGSLIDSPSNWQRHQTEVNRMAPAWMMAAAILVVAGWALLFFVHQQYDTPPPGDSNQAWTMPPDALPPVIAGALLANGSPRLEHAMAALVSLADRGELRIEEQPRVLGQRHFGIARTATKRKVFPYEEKLLEIVFGNDGHTTVSLSKARSRVMRQFRKFKGTLEPAMESAALLDHDRRTVRRRFAYIATACLIAAGVTALILAFLVRQFGPWLMLIPLALAIVGVSALICFAAHTPLSNEGIQRARQWRGFRRHLRDIARDREPSPGDTVVRQMLPYAIALGLAQSWASYLKKHRSAAPDWFRAMSAAGSDSAAAFSTFIAAGGAHPGGAHGGGAGAAAGGGGSGAS